MKFTAPRAQFERALTVAAAVSDRKTEQRILSCCLIRAGQDPAEPEHATVSATNLTTDSMVGLPLTDVDSGEVAANTKQLLQVVSAVDGRDVTVSLVDGWIHVRSGGAKFKIPAVDHREFPTCHARKGEHEIAPHHLARLLGGTVFATWSGGENRPSLESVCLTANGTVLNAHATNGHVAAIVKADVTAAAALTLDGVRIHRTGVQAILKLLGGAKDHDVALVSQTSDHVIVSLGDSCVAVKLGGTEGPTLEIIQGVLGGLQFKKVGVDGNKLQRALGRISLMAGGKASAVHLASSATTFAMDAAEPGMGEAAEEIEATPAGANLDVSVSADYLGAVLERMPPGEVTVWQDSGALDHVVIASMGDMQAVIAPVKM